MPCSSACYVDSWLPLRLLKWTVLKTANERRSRPQAVVMWSEPYCHPFRDSQVAGCDVKTSWWRWTGTSLRLWTAATIVFMHCNKSDQCCQHLTLPRQSTSAVSLPLDYCNPATLHVSKQLWQTAGGAALFGEGSESVLPVPQLRYQLHWLPVWQRITCKLADHAVIVVKTHSTGTHLTCQTLSMIFNTVYLEIIR